MKLINSFLNNKKQHHIDREWDKKLGIDTCRINRKHENRNNYAYEPTPYSVLERIRAEGYVDGNSHLVDYGCGFGRAGIYLNHRTGCRVTGIEYVKDYYDNAVINKGDNKKIEYIHTDARYYIPPDDSDRFYFFNPFSPELFREVLINLTYSYLSVKREMILIFYYPSDAYISILNGMSNIEFEDDTDCRDLYGNGDERERLVYYRLV